MFGLFKPTLAPEGPVEIRADVAISKPARDVYALIDWADERNAKRVTGNRVTQIDGRDDRYDMVMEFMPDLTFELLVTEAVPHSRYAYGCVIRPGCGNLAHSHETYEIEANGPDACHLTLICQTTFVDGLKMRDFNNELGTMAASVQSAVQKLKLQAELGADVAKALEERTLL